MIESFRTCWVKIPDFFGRVLGVGENFPHIFLFLDTLAPLYLASEHSFSMPENAAAYLQRVHTAGFDRKTSYSKVGRDSVNDYLAACIIHLAVLIRYGGSELLQQ